MSKNADNFLSLLPYDVNEGLTEDDILSALSISHGTFYALSRKFLAAGIIAFRRVNRVKYYYRVAPSDPSDPIDVASEPAAPSDPSDPIDVASDVAAPSDKKTVSGGKSKPAKKRKFKAVYDSYCQGLYPCIADFFQAVSELVGFNDYWRAPDEKILYVSLYRDEPEIWRYDYDDTLPLGAVEVWRHNFDRFGQYRLQGAEAVKRLMDNAKSLDN